MCNLISGVISSILAAIIFLVLYEFIIKKAIYYIKFKKYIGKFIHYNKLGIPFIYNPNGEPNYVEITISFWKPNVLINKAFDYDTRINDWKKWEGKVTIDTLSTEHGVGFFRYLSKPYPGTHEIFILNSNVFYVRITYYGEDNIAPNLQIWCREGYEKELPDFILSEKNKNVKENPFSFIGNLIHTEEKLPFNLFGEFFLKRATDFQIKIVKDFLEPYNRILTSKMNINKYECTINFESEEPNSLIYKKKEDWQYFIVDYNEMKKRDILHKVFSLSSFDITFLFDATYIFNNKNTKEEKAPAKVLHQHKIFNFLNDNLFNFESRKISIEDFKELEHIYSIVEFFDFDKFPTIDKALADLINLKDLSNKSPFKILNCFSILELILSNHSGNNTSQQIKAKLQYIEEINKNIFDFKIYITGFENISMLIGTLYLYRNDIAHGNFIDFKKKLAIIKDQQEKILPFLINLLRNLILFSIENSIFMSEVKKCEPKQLKAIDRNLLKRTL